MKIEKIILKGDLEMNCYIIRNNNDCYIVDPGYEKDKIIEYVRQQKLDVLGILITHAHIDHIDAVDCFPVPIYLHENDYPLFFDNSRNGADFCRSIFKINKEELNIIKIKDKTIIPFKQDYVITIHTPGHTSGSVCYLYNNILYTGDTLFKGGVGRWDFPTGNLNELQKSVIGLIDKQKPEYIICPGHGQESSIGEEKKDNDFYNQWKS